MPFFLSIPHSFVWVFFFFTFSLFFSLSFSDPRISIASLYCGTVLPPTNETTIYIPNFSKEMEVISQLVDRYRWANYSSGFNPPIFTLAQCMDDLSHNDCLLCHTESRTKIPRCVPRLSGRIFLDGCFLRYDNYSFYHESVDDQLDKVVCNSSAAVLATDKKLELEFNNTVNEVITNVTETAVTNRGFGKAEMKRGAISAYALAQCWKSVNKTGCKACLEKARKGVNSCLPGREGRGLNAGCYLRYSTEKFYSEGEEKKGNGGFSKTGIIIAISLAAFAFCMLSLFGTCLGYKRFSKIKEERNNLARLSSTVSKSNLNFKYETLEKATEYFSPSRKLGQGGAGSVFKGTLPDGKNVAVKRLFFNTRQWVDEFFNEVNLISGIKHKNLVQLLGCSIEGPESLLVYEYVANKSIDQVLFDKNTDQFLSWQQRFEIIVGTAEGLAFLHGGSLTRIIHRDIKCSNILLDENMTAKIADFGLARCFAADKSHISTGIAGTLGYMAPEYLVRGQLTDKADVYSFGVLLLEIVCGRKNTVFVQESGSILQTVWKHYKSNSLVESVDPSLRGDFAVTEASNVLQIGLLCTQASVSLRPSMSDVVQMLTNKDCVIPLPMQPPFLNASVMNPDASISFGTPTSASHGHIDTSTQSHSISSSASHGHVDTSTQSHSISSSASHESTIIELSMLR